MRPANNVIDEINLYNPQHETGKTQYLTFILAGDEYGVDILRVQEIKGWDNVTKIPNAPHYVKGVMNLRGSIVPIVDLRSRFGIETQEYGPTTVVVVLRIESQDKQRIMGIVVDAVSDVYDINYDAMQPAPDFGDNVNVEFIKGLATVDGKMVILLDVDNLLSRSELETLRPGGYGSNSSAPKAMQGEPSEKLVSNVELLEQSYSSLASRGEELVERFYNELFSRYPESKELFKNVSLKSQQNKLLAALQLVVTNIRNPQKIADTLQGLGERHNNYGATPELYKAVCGTLLDVLKEASGNQWTDEVNAVWDEALSNISKIMLKAAA